MIPLNSKWRGRHVIGYVEVIEFDGSLVRYRYISNGIERTMAKDELLWAFAKAPALEEAGQEKLL